jgi:hypothetical protein
MANTLVNKLVIFILERDVIYFTGYKSKSMNLQK